MIWKASAGTDMMWNRVNIQAMPMTIAVKQDQRIAEVLDICLKKNMIVIVLHNYVSLR